MEVGGGPDKGDASIPPLGVIVFSSFSLRAGALLAFLAPSLALAQTTPLADRAADGVAVRVGVTDRTTQFPIPAVRVLLHFTSGANELVWEGATGGEGFLLSPQMRLGEYRIELQALGFTSFTESLNFETPGSVDIAVAMVPEAVALEPLFVTVRRDSRLEREGFYRRQEQAGGYFLTRADIDLRSPARSSDLFLGIPGARVSSTRLGSVGGAITLRGGCVPTVVLNGSPITIPISLDELVNVNDIEALEIYHGATAPIQFAQFSSCGTIVVWLRERPAVQYGRPLTWRRIVGVAAVLGFVFLASK